MGKEWELQGVGNGEKQRVREWRISTPLIKNLLFVPLIFILQRSENPLLFWMSLKTQFSLWNMLLVLCGGFFFSFVCGFFWWCFGVFLWFLVCLLVFYFLVFFVCLRVLFCFVFLENVNASIRQKCSPTDLLVTAISGLLSDSLLPLSSLNYWLRT